MNKNRFGDLLYKGMNNMIIQNSEINIKFPRVENIKRKYILHEEILKDHFNEANILPIPDDAPAEIPRILIKSKNEHSQMNISPDGIKLQTEYSDKYTQDWSLCEKYITTRVNEIYELADKLTEERYDYIGVVANLLWDDITTEGNKILYRNLFGKDASSNLDDLVVRYTYIEEDKYYVNIAIQSARMYENIRPDESGNFTDENLKAHTISISLDINDRYLFNSKKDYVSTKEVFNEIMSLTTNIINNKLKDLVEKGEYHYEKE